MRIAVIGTGGVGGYFGAKLALGGSDVTFVARGRQLEAIRTDGLRIASESTPMHVRDLQVTDDPSLSGITCLTRQPLGVVRADPQMRAVFEAIMRETWTGVATPVNATVHASLIPYVDRPTAGH